MKSGLVRVEADADEPMIIDLVEHADRASEAASALRIGVRARRRCERQGAAVVTCPTCKFATEPQRTRRDAATESRVTEVDTGASHIAASRLNLFFVPSCLRGKDDRLLIRRAHRGFVMRRGSQMAATLKPKCSSRDSGLGELGRDDGEGARPRVVDVYTRDGEETA
jgi:hypothetical protein